MTAKRKRAFSLLEIVMSLALLLLLASMVLLASKKQRDNLDCKGTAERLVAFLRKARHTALSRHIPVAIAIPKNASHSHSGTLVQLEGEVDPQVSEVWNIEQDSLKTVFFVGRWAGPRWTPLIGSSTLNLSTWWESQTPLAAALFAFDANGRLISSEEGCDGQYRIAVVQGLQSAAGNLLGATNPFTVSLSPAGQVSWEPGLYGSVGVLNTNYSQSPPGAVYLSSSRGPNSGPVIQTLIAKPNLDNPAGASLGKVIDLSSNLTLEARVKDRDGDPPFIVWKVSEAVDAGGGNLDPDTRGGRFSGQGQTRMEWSEETREWVGRTCWTPDRSDLGGNGYKIECTIRDRKGAEVTGRFPVTGYLRTTKEPWILYKTMTPSGHYELWKMTALGQEHTRVVALPNQDIDFGQWSPSGEEVVFVSAGNLYRAKNDGSALRLVAALGNLDACCLSPDGSRFYYVEGPGDDKNLAYISLDLSGREVSHHVWGAHPTDEIHNLSVARCGSRNVAVFNFYRHYRQLLGTRRVFGLRVVDADTGEQTNDDPTQTNLGGVGQNRSTTGGASLTSDGAEVIWGRGGQIFFASHNFGTAAIPAMALNSISSIPAPGPDVHHPRYLPDKSGFIVANGRGAAARLWYVNKSNPTDRHLINLDPSNLSADQPSVGPPR